MPTDNTELKEILVRLDVIEGMIIRHLASGAPLLVTTDQFLRKVLAVTIGKDIEEETEELDEVEIEQFVIMSCDASVKKNPGGPSAAGVVILYPPSFAPDAKKRRMEYSQRVPGTSCNQAEYDAVYFGLTTLMNLRNNPGCPIEVRSDSLLVVNQLNGDMKCHDEHLRKRRDLIKELIANLPVPVRIVWRPRNSTPELELANYLAQDLLKVPRR